MTKNISMPAPTPIASKAADAARRRAFQLRTIRHKHASEVARLSRTIIDAAKKMMVVEAQMNAESIAIAGEEYEEEQVVLFQPFPDDINDQVRNNGELFGLPFREIVTYVSEVNKAAEAEAKRALPPAAEGGGEEEEE